MPRLFVAIPLPDPICDDLGELTASIPGARWTLREQLHVTLRFLGDVGPSQVRDLEEALAAIRAEPFELQLAGVGHFPPRGAPKVLWAGVEKSEPLLRLQHRVERAVAAVRLPVDARKYHPHVTLARLSGAPSQRVADFLAGNGLYRSDVFPVDEFGLYSSVLRDDGAQHTLEVSFELRHGI